MHSRQLLSMRWGMGSSVLHIAMIALSCAIHPIQLHLEVHYNVVLQNLSSESKIVTFVSDNCNVTDLMPTVDFYDRLQISVVLQPRQMSQL